MSSPVLKALVDAEREEAERQARSISAAVAQQLGPPPEPGNGKLPAEFAAWCARNRLDAIPARPASIALFVLQHAGLGIEPLSRMVVEISQVHLRRGQADPTIGYPVATALNHIAKLDPPRSWPKQHKARFQSLPHDLQVYVARHEAQRDKEIRRAHNEAAIARRQLTEQPPKAMDHGTIETTAA
jgi:hypothetical protein